VESDRESRPGDSRDNETASDNSRRLKVVTVAALAGISYDFGQPNIMKTYIRLMESYTRYFPKGYGRGETTPPPPDVESVLEPRVNEAIIFEDFFAVGLHMPPHPVLGDILRKF
jgi:hypothetical protein